MQGPSFVNVDHSFHSLLCLYLHFYLPARVKPTVTKFPNPTRWTFWMSPHPCRCHFQEFEWDKLCLFPFPRGTSQRLCTPTVWQINLASSSESLLSGLWKHSQTGLFMDRNLRHLIACLCIPESDVQNENQDIYQQQCLLVRMLIIGHSDTWGELAVAA